MNPRKLLPSNENPFDNILYIIIEKIEHFFYKLNFTPNMITTLSLIFSILSTYYLFNNNTQIATICYLLSYFFDCLDGYYARKYNMVTEVGDWYDHITDIIGIIGLYYIFFIKKKYISIIISLFFAVLLLIHMGCQEKIFSNTKSPSLNILKLLCSNTKNIKYTRWCGCGTYTLVNIILILIN
tara:strand:+ start:13728 stop:14276 length:549 start_codon:yes stop_codon:yes gene_type:complete